MALNISDALSQNVVDKRIDVLQRIKQYGSISEAARSAGISYKAAWQAIETLSALAGEPLVEKTVGGNSGGGARITEAGEAVLEASAALNKVRNQILTDIQGGESPKLAALASVALRMSIRNIIPCVIGRHSRRNVHVQGQDESLRGPVPPLQRYARKPSVARPQRRQKCLSPLQSFGRYRL